MGHRSAAVLAQQQSSAFERSIPRSLFMAEVYWDLEWTIQQQGFDYAYDKHLCDRLHAGHTRPVRDHLRAGLDYQVKAGALFLKTTTSRGRQRRFLSNGMAPRLIVTFLTPGLRFFSSGQWTGTANGSQCTSAAVRSRRRTAAVQALYERLLACLRHPAVCEGEWQLLECVPAWAGNWTVDCFIAFSWRDEQWAFACSWP